MSGWDSTWKTTLKVRVDGRPVELEYRAVYDTPSYVALEACVLERELKRLGYLEPDGGVTLDSADRESSRVDARSMDDSDVYDLLAGKLKKLARLVARGSRGLTRAELERLMKRQGLDTAWQGTLPLTGAPRPRRGGRR